MIQRRPILSLEETFGLMECDVVEFREAEAPSRHVPKPLTEDLAPAPVQLRHSWGSSEISFKVEDEMDHFVAEAEIDVHDRAGNPHAHWMLASQTFNRKEDADKWLNGLASQYAEESKKVVESDEQLFSLLGGRIVFRDRHAQKDAAGHLERMGMENFRVTPHGLEFSDRKDAVAALDSLEGFFYNAESEQN